MKNNAAKGTQVTLMRKRIAYYASQLSSCLDKKSLRAVYMLPRRAERMYAYDDIIVNACSMCFRSRYDDNGMLVIYGFDGKIWSPLGVYPRNTGDFENIVRDALVSCADQSDYIIKSDWVDKRKNLMEYAYKGVKESSLPYAKSVVGFQNGVYDFSDIDNVEYHSFEDAMPVTELLPYDYDPSAGCPVWLNFLNMMLSPVEILKLQKYFGLGIVNRRAMTHRVEDSLWMVGNGANGKSTIENVVTKVYGESNVSNASMSQLLDKSSDTRMRNMLSIEGKVFNICDEVDMQDITKGSDAFKKLCSGEPQNVRGIGTNVRKAFDIPFMVFSMNQMPSNRKMDDAFRRRIVTVNFRSRVHEVDMDGSLEEKLEEELSGIRNWMVEGYKKLRADGFKFAHTTDENYMEQNEQYFDIFCHLKGYRASAWAGHDEKAQMVSVKAMYDAYCSFCEKNLYPVASQKSMSSDLKRLGFRSVRKSAGVFYEVFCDNEIDIAIR